MTTIYKLLNIVRLKRMKDKLYDERFRFSDE